MFTYRFTTRLHPLGLTVDSGAESADLALKSIRRFLRRWNRYQPAAGRAPLPRSTHALQRASDASVRACAPSHVEG